MSHSTSPDSQAVHGPKDGKYYILPAVAPRVIAGADGIGNPWVPIVVDGKNNVFTVKKLDSGDYSLILEDSEPPLFIQHHDGNLVANVKSPPGAWTIRGTECGPYTIGIPTHNFWTQGWTLESEKPGSIIPLSLLEVPGANQYWNFVPKLGLLSK